MFKMGTGFPRAKIEGPTLIKYMLRTQGFSVGRMFWSMGGIGISGGT